jgi:hypothetical protein
VKVTHLAAVSRLFDVITEAPVRLPEEGVSAEASSALLQVIP